MLFRSIRYVDPMGREKVSADQLRYLGSMLGVGKGFNYDTLAAGGITMDAALDSLKQAANQEWESSGGPARLDAIKEVSAGFGDMLAVFVPTQTIRAAAGIEVDKSSGYYKGGGLMGTVASIVLPFKATGLGIGGAAGASSALGTAKTVEVVAGEGAAVVRAAAPAARGAATVATQPSLAFAATVPNIAGAGTRAAQLAGEFEK